MSETIGEMILPGTYIDVRAEGLIGVSGISTGNVGIVGSANRGPVDKVELLGSYGQALDTFGRYDAWPDTASAEVNALTLTRTLEQLFKGGARKVYAVRVASGTPSAAKVPITDGTDTLFKLAARTPGTWANSLKVTLTPAAGGQPVKVVLESGRIKEEHVGANAGELADAINADSVLVNAEDLAAGDRADVPTTVGTRTDGSDGNPPATTDVKRGLDLLAVERVNIVVVGGFAAKDIADTVKAHLEETENNGAERMAVLGASADDVAGIKTNDVSKGGSARVVLVAPGIVTDDAERTSPLSRRVKLPASYAAALVAGKLSTLAPHVSLTNKDVPVGDLRKIYTRAEQEELLTQRVLVLFRNPLAETPDTRVLKGITTEAGAFRQISVRRIVDYAKAGVRAGSNPYIGRLNNTRVRAALKATLDGFLSGMVLDEMLTAYTLDVSATRAQELVGQAIVTMTLQPTFSIDFVKVIMNLG